ncbi:hypothetical protein [Microbacterium esteraromaticum]|uniref:hypothetical protein n=1 Tax=Microbacterium esteraromaticum TaxID=57043 RepID=UPI001C94B797|nr:hypothetical protein [Microbacterium esteraromaticum]MBY6061392.1 hypothetical protein [Microbacterium esteraromaticum]
MAWILLGAVIGVFAVIEATTLWSSERQADARPSRETQEAEPNLPLAQQDDLHQPAESTAARATAERGTNEQASPAPKASESPTPSDSRSPEDRRDPLSPELPQECPVGAVGWAYESATFFESDPSVLRNLGIGNEYDIRVSVSVLNSSNWTVRLNSLNVAVDYNTAQHGGTIPLSIDEITLAPDERRSFTTGWKNAVSVSDTDTFDFEWRRSAGAYPSKFSWVAPPAECYAGGPYDVTFVP